MSTAKTIPAASLGDGQLSRFIVSRENPSSLVHAARTTVAAVVSYLIARLFRLREAHWAPISTLIGMQSTLGASLPVSVQRFASTAIGAAVGAVAATYFHESVWAFGVNRSGYRIALCGLAG